MNTIIANEVCDKEIPVQDHKITKQMVKEAAIGTAILGCVGYTAISILSSTYKFVTTF